MCWCWCGCQHGGRLLVCTLYLREANSPMARLFFPFLTSSAQRHLHSMAFFSTWLRVFRPFWQVNGPSFAGYWPAECQRGR